MLERLNPEGYFSPKDPRSYFLYGQLFIYPLAYFYKTNFPDNPYFKDQKILQVIIKLGDYVAKVTDSNGEINYSSYGNKGKMVDQRLLTFWADAYFLIKDELESSRRVIWEKTFLRSAGNLAMRIKGYLEQRRFNWMSFSTGPNHAILYAVALYLAGIILQKKDWCRLADKFTVRFAEYQHPDGYWAEDRGPTPLYNIVSLAGIARMNVLSPQPVYREVLRRALNFHKTVSYPDFTHVATIDKRCRYHSSPFTWGHFGFSIFPEGRSFIKQAALVRLKAPVAMEGEECARWLENFIHYQEGEIPAYHPWKGCRQLTTVSGFIRKGAWEVTLSADASIVSPRNPFNLGNNNHFSLWHKTTGLIINGSQDKKHPLHNTFLPVNKRLQGPLVGGRIGLDAKPKYLEAIYPDFVGRLEVKWPNVSTCLIRAVIGGPSKERFLWNIPLFVKPGDSIRLNNQDVKLGKTVIRYRLGKGNQILFASQKAIISTSTPCTFHWPCLPFNSYSKNNRSSFEMAFARLEIPLKPGKKVELITHVC